MSVASVPVSEAADVNPKATTTPNPAEPIAFVGMADLDDVGAEARDSVLRPYGEVAKAYTPFENGDVLLAKITPCFENRKIGQARTSTQLAAGSTEFHVIRPHDGVLDRRFLLHFLRQDWVLELGELRMTGSAGQRRVPERFLDELQIPLPPIEEQRRIAAVLDVADELRAKRRQALAKLDTLTQVIFIDMFGDPSSDWAVEELADVVADGTTVTYGIVQAGEEFEGGVPYIRTGDIVDGEIAVEKLRRTDPAIAARFPRSRIRAGEIVMSIRATVGTTALVTEAIDGANLTQGTARIAPGDTVTPLYLLHFLRSEPTQRWIQQQVKGATFREITLKRLRELPVALPPVALQREFASRLELSALAKARSRSSLQLLDTLFASLQQRAFRGEL